MTAQAPNFLKLKGHHSLPLRLVLSTLLSRPVIISDIRTHALSPGLTTSEISFLRLLESLTNGSSIQISYTGTTLSYIPGILSGSSSTTNAAGIGGGANLVNNVIEHKIPRANNRGISWFLIPICVLAPFAKGVVNVRFVGDGVITGATDMGDVSVDTVRTAILPLFDLFGIPSIRLELRVLQRSCAGPKGQGGGGIVELRFEGQVRLPKTLHLHREPGRVRRIRGVAYSIGVSASNNGRMIHEARGVLNKFMAGGGDVQVAAVYEKAPLVDAAVEKGAKAEKGKKEKIGVGFGMQLVAETSVAGVFYTADVVAPPEGGTTPEDVGKKAALQLLENVEKGGCVGLQGASPVLVLMAMGSEDVGRVRLGRKVLGTEEVIGLGMDLRAFGASAWGMRDADGDEEGESDDVNISVKGTGVGNVGRKIA